MNTSSTAVAVLMTTRDESIMAKTSHTEAPVEHARIVIIAFVRVRILSTSMFRDSDIKKQVGVLQDEKTGSWYGSAEGAAQGAKKAVEMMYNQAKGETENKKKRTGPVADLRPGQAVRIGGLLKAPQLNGKRGIVQRLNPNDHERWEVELRLERGQVDIKSIRAENIVTVKKSDSQAWQAEEAVFAEARKGRQRDEKRWKEEEDKRKRMDQLKRQTAMDGFPTMDESEQLEAEMSCLLLDEESMALLRRLKAKEALDMLQQASLGGVSDLSRVMKVKARQKLGEAAPAPPNMAPPTMAPPTMAPPTMSPPTMSPPAYPPAAAAAAVEEASVDSDSSDEDFDHLEEETEAPPDRGSVEEEPTEEQQANHGRWKAEAVEALEAGDVSLALERYSQVIANGGATALLLTKRGELLLKQRRPLAAIGDCAAALEQNPDLGKAYRIRGIAHRKLGHWRDAQRDLVEGQRLDYDDGTAAVQKFAAALAFGPKSPVEPFTDIDSLVPQIAYRPTECNKSCSQAMVQAPYAQMHAHGHEHVCVS